MMNPIAGRLLRSTAVLTLALCLLLLPGAAGSGGDGGLEGLSAAMGEAEGLLRQGLTGEQVRTVQEDVVRQLDALIAFYEQQEASGLRSVPGEGEPGSQEPSGMTARPLRAAEESVLPPGSWKAGPMRALREPGEAWLPGLPAAERRQVADTFSTGRLPPRYRELLRRYNKRLAEEGAGGE